MYILQYEKKNNELEKKFHQIEKFNSKRIIYEQIINNLKKVFDDNVSTKKKISTQRLKNLLNLTICDDYLYTSYKTCTY